MSETKFNYRVKTLPEEKHYFINKPHPRDKCFFEGVEINEYKNIPLFYPHFGQTVGVGELNLDSIWMFERNLNELHDLMLKRERMSLDEYSKHFEKTTETVIERGIVFINSGDDHSWSHFMQDAAPLISEKIKFLKENEDVKIIFHRPEEHISFFIKEICGLSNEIIFLDNIKKTGRDIIIIKSLYLVNYFPRSIFLNKIPPECNIKKMGDLVKDKLKKSSERNFLYISRSNTPRRNVINESRIISICKDIAEENNLNFIKFLHEEHPLFIDRFNLFYNSEIVVAPHGGASFHVYACTKDCKWIEFAGHREFDGSIAHLGPALVDYRIKYYDDTVCDKNLSPYNDHYVIKSNALRELIEMS
jgi:capsular polysaccharide biosynthesis protein